MKLPKNYGRTLLITVMVVMIGGLISWLTPDQNQRFSQQAHRFGESRQDRLIPIVLVPGTHATNQRFNGFISNLMTKTPSRDVLKIQVSKTGTITTTGKIRPHAVRPFIVIGFEDNSLYAVDKEGAWLQAALVYAKQKYHFSQYDAVCHSNGGLALTAFLTHHKTKSDPRLRRLVTIATPYNDTKLSNNRGKSALVSKQNESHLLKLMIAGNQSIPKNIEVLALAGAITPNEITDSAVPVQSALAAQQVYKPIAKSYAQQIFTGSKNEVSHSALVENSDVINRVRTFIYKH